MTLPPPGEGAGRVSVGEQLREWVITRFLGRGSYGVVFEARKASWVESGERRALKVFDPVLSAAARSTLIGEFETLISVRHPNLVAGFDAFDLTDGPHAGCVIFVMELADDDLGSHIQRRHGIAVREVAAVGAQVADGLAALHDEGRIHGDVKPENILRVGEHWKLGDFGMSTALEGSYALTAGTTVDYRPPEYADAPEGARLHRSADIWALGVSLHVAATGHHPFVGPDPIMRFGAAVRGDRHPAPRLDPELRAVLDGSCLRPDPRERPDAASLAATLRDVVDPPPVPPPGSFPPPGERRDGHNLPNPALRGALVAVAAIVVAALGAEALARAAGSLPWGLGARRIAYLVALVVAVGTVAFGARRLPPPVSQLPPPWATVASVGASVAALVSTAVLFGAFG